MKPYVLVIPLLFVFKIGYTNTAFFSQGKEILLAKNHDSKSGHGMLIQNLPGQKKTAYGFHSGDRAQWMSIYGSVTYNQLGKEFPLGGMNEAGLVVEHLFLGTSEYPELETPSLTELEWIQYQLDNYGSVNEVVANLHRLRIRPLETVHFIVADPCGNSAVIDFVGRDIQITRKEGSYQVMTQTSAETALSHFAENHEKTTKSGNSALDKYALLMGHLGLNPNPDIKSSFDLLDISSNKSGQQKTQWGVVYDLDSKCIYLKTQSFPQVRSVCLSEFEFDSKSITLASPIQTKSLQWSPMTANTHANLLALGLKHEQLKLDEDNFVQHMTDPIHAVLDSVYSKNQVDLVVRFVTNKPSGLVSYIFKQDQLANQSGNGLKSGQFVVEKKETVRVIYNMPKVQLALACFQDTEFKGTIESKLDPNSSGFSFLRTQGYHSGNMPKYVDAKIDLRQQTDVTVRIK